MFWLVALVVISFVCTSKLPPSCGDVSATTSKLTLLPEAAVIRPCASTVIVGIDVELPYEFGVTAVFAS